MDFNPLITQAATQAGIDPDLLRAQLLQESGLNPNAVGPPTKYGQAQGIAQFIPSTAQGLGINPMDPNQAIPAAAQMDANNIKQFGTPAGAMAAYYGGPDQNNWGPNTQRYVSDVARRFANLKQSGQTVAAPSDPLDAMLAQRAASPEPKNAPPVQPKDPLDAMLENRAAAQVSPTSAPQQTPVADDWRTRLMGSNVGALMHGAMQPVYGANQLIDKTIQGVTSLGGAYPNAVSNAAGDLAENFTRQKAAEDAFYRRAQTASGNTGAMSSANELAGNVLSPANLATAMVNAPTTLGRLLLQGASSAAVQPTDTTKDYTGQKELQMAGGAGINALLHGAGSAASALVNPVLDKSAALLMKSGIPLTAGQVLGGSARTLEDAATSIPIVGDIIKNRRADSFRALSTAMVDRSLAPLGEKVPSDTYGHDAIAYAQDRFDTHYGDILSGMSARADPQLATDLSDVLNHPGNYQISPSQVDTLKNFVDDKIIGRSDNGHFDGDALKAVQSDISDQIRRATRGNASPGDYNYADALGDVRSSFNDFLTRHNPDEAPILKAIDSGYRNLVVAEKAAGNAVGGVFSAAQLGNAVRSGGTRRSLATGTAFNQDLSNAARDILPSKVPDSGTPIRHAVELGLGLAGGHMVAPETAAALTGPAMVAAGLGALLAAGATKPAQKAIVGLLAKRPYSPQTAAKLAELLKAGAPIAGRGLIPALVAPGNYVAPQQ